MTGIGGNPGVGRHSEGADPTKSHGEGDTCAMKQAREPSKPDGKCYRPRNCRVPD